MKRETSVSYMKQKVISTMRFFLFEGNKKKLFSPRKFSNIKEGYLSEEEKLFRIPLYCYSFITSSCLHRDRFLRITIFESFSFY